MSLYIWVVYKLLCDVMYEVPCNTEWISTAVSTSRPPSARDTTVSVEEVALNDIRLYKLYSFMHRNEVLPREIWNSISDFFDLLPSCDTELPAAVSLGRACANDFGWPLVPRN